MELEFIKEFDFEGIGMEFDHAFWSCLVGWNWNGIVKGKVSKNQTNRNRKKRTENQKRFCFDFGFHLDREKPSRAENRNRFNFGFHLDGKKSNRVENRNRFDFALGFHLDRKKPSRKPKSV
jgi:hypothetical protein